MGRGASMLCHGIRSRIKTLDNINRMPMKIMKLLSLKTILLSLPNPNLFIRLQKN